MSDYEVSHFYNGVRKFYMQTMHYIKSLNVLQHAKLVEFLKREMVMIRSVGCFVHHLQTFKKIKKRVEFRQLLSDSDILAIILYEG